MCVEYLTVTLGTVFCVYSLDRPHCQWDVVASSLVLMPN